MNGTTRPKAIEVALTVPSSSREADRAEDEQPGRAVGIDEHAAEDAGGGDASSRPTGRCPPVAITNVIPIAITPTTLAWVSMLRTLSQVGNVSGLRIAPTTNSTTTTIASAYSWNSRPSAPEARRVARRRRGSCRPPPTEIGGHRSGATAWRRSSRSVASSPVDLGDELALAHDEDAACRSRPAPRARTRRRARRAPPRRGRRSRGRARPWSRRRRRGSARRAAAPGSGAAASAPARPSAGCRRRAGGRSGRRRRERCCSARSCSPAAARSARTLSRPRWKRPRSARRDVLGQAPVEQQALRLAVLGGQAQAGGDRAVGPVRAAGACPRRGPRPRRGWSTP